MRVCIPLCFRVQKFSEYEFCSTENTAGYHSFMYLIQTVSSVKLLSAERVSDSVVKSCSLSFTLSLTEVFLIMDFNPFSLSMLDFVKCSKLKVQC